MGMNSVIFEDENFIFGQESGIGREDTPWTGLRVRTKEGSPAYKHVIEIRLNDKGWHDFNGEPVNYSYSDCYVAHGVRGTSDTLDDTKEYIETLSDAVDFAERVNDWLFHNQDVNASTSIKASTETKTYTVSVNFAGYIGADEEYEVDAEDDDEAEILAVEAAMDDLSVTDITQIDDDEWEVTIRFASHVGGEEIYTVNADSENEAESEALEEASSDLSAEIVNILEPLENL